MPIFPSREWMTSFSAELSAHPDVDRIAQALDGTYRFIIEPAGPLTEVHRYDITISPGPQIVVLDDPVPDATLELIADHDRWRQLIEGTLDVTMALMLRRLRVRGDLSRLLGRLDSARPLLEALSSVPTEWLDQGAR